VKISEVLETTCQRGKQPEALARRGLATLRQFLQESCGAAALDSSLTAVSPPPYLLVPKGASAL